MMTTPPDLRAWFGAIDIYLFDQLLKGRITPAHSVLDAGCGDGRNIIYFLRAGYDVCAVDQSEAAIAHVRALAAQLAPQLPSTNFRVEPVERLSFPADSFALVISSAVLHFARDEAHWHAMLAELWRVLRPGGLFFARLAATIGVETLVRPHGGRRYTLPDGSERFLVDAEMLDKATRALGGTWLEPLKTTVVQAQRAMTTWCLRKV
jgi:tellurite methyltransferase